MGYKSNLKKQRKQARLIKKYRDDPVAFCEKYLGIELFDYQKKILVKQFDSARHTFNEAVNRTLNCMIKPKFHCLKIFYK